MGKYYDSSILRKPRYFQFKDNKYSVEMKLLHMDENGNCELCHTVYPIYYKAHIDDLVELFKNENRR